MEGRVEVCGIDTRQSTCAELARKVGIVLQSAESQLVGLTVEEDVEFGLENMALPVDEIIQRRKEALEIVQMQDYAQASPWNLSGGQKQRVAIASALAFRPEILVLDNPTAELDPMGKEDVLQTIARLNRDYGITIVVVDQELQEVIPYAHRIAILDEGKIIALGTPEEVLDQSQLLRDAGVKLPDVTEIGYQLRKVNLWSDPLPVRIPDTVKMIEKIAKTHTFSSKVPIRPIGSPIGQPLIEIKDLQYRYPGGRLVLKGIDLTIHQGEFVALMGQNGAGKTTLAKHLNGLLKPTAGTVLVDGMDTREHTVAVLASKVGYVFQNPDHQIFSKNVLEELSFGPKNLGWPPERIQEEAERALKDIDMEGRGEAEPFFMGLAERKLIAIASILIMKPEVLVLDEPATGADYGVALRIMRYISELHRRGLTVVIITHDVSLVANYASRLIVVRDGTIALDGTPEEVFAQVDLLRQCQISLPQVTELSNCLGHLGIPGNILRVQDMVDILKGA